MSIESLRKEINKKYNEELMVKGSKIKDCVRWSTGSLALDLEIGGGYPTGKIITVLGNYSDGKTSTVLKGVAEFQIAFPDKEVVWVDVEGSWDRNWAQQLGVRADDVWVVQPAYQQQAFDIIDKCIEHDAGLIVLDSVAALVPKEEAEASFEDWQIGLAARINSKAMRGFQSTLNTKAESGVPPTLILINQLRDQIGMYKPQAEPGGRAISFHSSLKIYLRKGDLFPKPKDNYDVSVVPKAQQVKFYVEKNKTAPPKTRGFFWFYFDTADKARTKGTIDHTEELVRYCQEYKVINQVSKGWFTIEDPITGELSDKIHGINSCVTLLRKHPDWYEPMKALLLQRVKEKYDSAEEQELVDSSVETTDEDKGVEGSKEGGSPASEWFGFDSVGERGSDINSASLSAQTDGKGLAWNQA